MPAAVGAVVGVAVVATRKPPGPATGERPGGGARQRAAYVAWPHKLLVQTGGSAPSATNAH